jgi:hypothetical protein
MSAGKSMLRRAAITGAMVTAAAVGVPAHTAHAGAAAVPPTQDRWAASMATAHARGFYTVTETSAGRTYAITGVLLNDWGGQCYFMRVNGGFPPGQESDRSCGPSEPVRIDFKVTVSSSPVSVQICRGLDVTIGCGEATRLS